MNELDKMFEAPKEASLPPLVRYCKNRQEAGDRFEIELYRPDEHGGRTDLVIHHWQNETEQTPQQVEWDDAVNAGMVELGIRATDLQQEGERFAFGIRAALRPAERKYGDGYLSAVVVELLDGSDLFRGGEIAEVRQFVRITPPERSKSYDACRDLVASEISGRAVELRENLKYDVESIKTVMTKALAIYLDERFSVSSRRKFGLL